MKEVPPSFPRWMLLSDCARDALTYGTQAEEKGTTPTTRTGTQKTGESPKGKPLYLACLQLQAQ